MEAKTAPNVIFRIEYDKYSKERNPFYACKNNGKKCNIVEYVQSGAEDRLNIVDYTGNKEKSSGAFDRKGLMDEERLQKTKAALQKTHSVIWHGCISFEEKFGEGHMRCYEDAYNLMKTQLPKFIKAAGLDYKNISWFAGMHQNTENRHIHLVFYERRGTHKQKGKKVLQYSKGKIDKEAFAGFKVDMENWLSGTWKKTIALRDKLTFSGAKGQETSSLFNLQHIQKDIIKLAEMLPETGHTSYSSANMLPLRPMITDMVYMVLRSNPAASENYNAFLEALHLRDEQTLELCNYYGANPSGRLVLDKINNDLYNRIGNKLIAFAKAYKSDVKTIESRRSGKIATKHIKRRRLNKLLDDTLNLVQSLIPEADRCFEEFLEKLEEFEYERHQGGMEM